MAKNNPAVFKYIKSKQDIDMSQAISLAVDVYPHLVFICYTYEKSNRPGLKSSGGGIGYLQLLS